MSDMLEQVKGFLRIDGSEDDINLTLLIDSAKESLKTAGVQENNSALYRLSILIYVALQYDPDSYAKLESTLQTNILKMKYNGEES
ncbi:head-tail connector protein [Bacillus cytotoxicus]|uniref:Head-tail connector protein n=1 Tax=Bacillus cytotoxicus TaxID=580165 RepID=A0ACC6A795_9BACI|nr:head-tail connector protein [Bacillus cytotoxicus]